MTKDIPFEKIIQTALRNGADYVDVFAENTNQTTIVCDNKLIEQASKTFDAGCGIRVIKDGHTAYASTNDLTKRGLLDLARHVSKTLKHKRTKTDALVLEEKSTPSVTIVHEHPSGIRLQDKCAIVSRANDVAWMLNQKIRQVKILYRDTVRKITVATSNGNLTCDEQIDLVFSSQVIAANESTMQTGYETLGGACGFEIFNNTPPEEIAERAASRAIKLLSARPAPAGTMTVILASEAGGTMIHEAVGHGLEADIACEGLSVYSGRIGETVASKLVSVADDGSLAGKRGTTTFDDEGTHSQRTILIENGVLKSYLSNMSTAMRFKIPLTGNGRRQSYESPPIVRMTNTLILSGKDDPQNILTETRSGLFVKRMGGGQVNTINGDFVFDIQEGYLIEDGKIGELVRGATLIGNGPQVLKIIDRVGSDMGFSIGTCGKEGQEAPVSCGQPTIRIPEITVGGTA